MNNNHYESQLQKINSQKYNLFFNNCRTNIKFGDKGEKAKYKTLEKCYRLFQSYGVPFDVANGLFPKLCNEMAQFQSTINKYTNKEEDE